MLNAIGLIIPNSNGESIPVTKIKSTFINAEPYRNTSNQNNEQFINAEPYYEYIPKPYYSPNYQIQMLPHAPSKTTTSFTNSNEKPK